MLVDENNWSLLHAAFDNLAITELLIAHGAGANWQAEDSWTPLLFAARWCQREVAKFLVEHGANIDKINDSGDTALHLAIIAHDAYLVNYFLKKEADWKIKTRSDLTCLTLAVTENQDSTLEALLSIQNSTDSNSAWTFEDMAAAYWIAIAQQSPELLDILVKKERRLLDEVSSEGFTGLETCLRNRGRECKEEPVAIRLLEHGVDPFKRHGLDQESGFTPGIISRDNVKLEFMDACVKQVLEDSPSAASALGFKELRIAAELDKMDLWKKLEPLRNAVSAEKDLDDWSIDHFLYQSGKRLPEQLRDVQPLSSTKKPTGLIVPPMWLPPDTDVGARMEISSNKVQVSFTCEYRHSFRILIGRLLCLANTIV